MVGRDMKKIFTQIAKKIRQSKDSTSFKKHDFRRDAERFVKEMGPAIKQLSKE
jgi:hypothetical protein